MKWIKVRHMPPGVSAGFLTLDLILQMLLATAHTSPQPHPFIDCLLNQYHPVALRTCYMLDLPIERRSRGDHHNACPICLISIPLR